MEQKTLLKNKKNQGNGGETMAKRDDSVKKKVPEKRNAHLVCFSKSLNIHLPYMITNIIDI